MIIAATLVSRESLVGNSSLNLQRPGAALSARDPAPTCLFWEEYMPGRGRSTFNKRQKEISRQEKRREKAARKQQRKLEKQSGFLGLSVDSTTTEPPVTESLQSPDESAADSNVTQECDQN
jgi:hypothetical protein